jgi:predicted nucleic acid-binding protein
MARTIVLDSAPLGLIAHRPGMPAADRCRAWVLNHVAAGSRVCVPEIIDYELRRELVRSGNSRAIAQLDAFYATAADRYLPLTTGALRRAAQLWADLRNAGLPTAHAHDLDIDVILAAQALELGIPVQDFVIATTNVNHLGRLVPAAEWHNI